MKKTRFFLMALLVISVLTFTGCGDRGSDTDGIRDDDESRSEQDINNGADDVKDDADDLGDDVRDDADDLGDDIRDDVTGDDTENRTNTGSTL